MKSIEQRDFKDCGVTCLEYIIEYYKGYVPIEKLREATFTNQNGTTAYHLVETLKKYGFDSYGQKIRYKDLEDIIFPCIVHLILSNGMNHFAVLVKCNEKEVLLMDPAFGKRKLSKEDFTGIWDGIVLLAIPETIIPKIPKDKSIILHVLSFLKKQKKLFLIIVICSIFTSFLSIFLNFYFKIGVEKVSFLEHKELCSLILLFAAFTSFKILFSYIKNYFTIYVNKNIEVEYLYTFVTHLLKIPMKKFSTYHEGELMTRMEEVREIKDLFQEICVTFFLEGFLSITSILILFQLNQKLSIMIVIGMLGYLFIGVLTSKFFYQLVRKNMIIEQEWNESILENFKLFPTMKHLNQTNYQIEKVENHLCNFIKEKKSIEKKALTYQWIKTNYLEILFFCITTLGIFLIKKTELTLIDFITFQNLYLYFINPIKELTDIGPKFCYMKGILSKISETMAWQEESLIEEKESNIILSIKVDNLSFTYNQISQIFSQINFEINEGEHIFLDGKSGCGKSTFCKILHREENSYEGEIFLGNKNLKDYELSVIRKSILYLSQNETIFRGTIKENILFGSSENERFEEITKICEIESIVSKRPFRYETKIYEDTLSGGEKQRIMLARILMKEASVYILDECLSEVERKLEIKIIKNIRELLKNKIIIYISHTDNSKYFERRIHFAHS